MRPELPVISFLCVVLLAIFIPVRRIRSSVPNLSLVAWLLGCNFVHGINAIIWADNADNRAPVWCDIVTKLLLGSSIAIAGACVCISSQLELVSSSRDIPTTLQSSRNRMLLEALLCYVIPMIYMLLHFIAQDHRFDLVQDLGCSASIHPSLEASIVMWLPPILVCSISIVFSGRALSNSFRVCSVRFYAHLESRSSTISTSLFFRRITMSLAMTTLVLVLIVFSMFSSPVLLPWISWANVHAHFADPNLLLSEDEVRGAKFAWWGILAQSIVYIVLSFVLGEEARDSAKWIQRQIISKREAFNRHNVQLRSLRSPDLSEPAMVSRSSSLGRPHLRPVTIELKSGWDDMLDIKTSKRTFPSLTKPSTTSTSKCSSPSLNAPSPSPDDDDVFMANTISYLGSPTAKALGVSSPTLIPPAHISPRKLVHDTLPVTVKPSIPAVPPAPSISSQPEVFLRTPNPLRTNITSVFDVPWPVPPSSPLSGSASSRYRPRSRSHSPVSSADDEEFGCPLYPTVTPPHLRTRPFEGSSISSMSAINPSQSDMPKSIITKMTPKRPSLKSIRHSWSREKVKPGLSPVEIIHMTVVKEVV